MTGPGELITPRVVVDLDVLEQNVERMARAVGEAGVVLRPHAKTHKMLPVADRQLAAGAVGLTVATIGEAEVFADHGVEELFIAYPVWVGREAAVRLRDLCSRARIAVGVESEEAAAAMGRGLGSTAGQVRVLVEIDSGHGRTGVLPADARTVARAAERSGLNVAGVFTFPGHSYAPGQAAAVAAAEHAALTAAATHVRGAGFDIAVVSGGSTPTALLTTADAGGITELRPGVYVFGDAQQWELGACRPEEIALTALGTVVSRHPGRIVLDAGSKVLGADRAPWATGHGRLLDHPAARITGLSEHHAVVAWPDDQQVPSLGERLRVVPNHVCNAVNLVDEVTVVRGGDIVDTWSVAARGRNG